MTPNAPQRKLSRAKQRKSDVGNSRRHAFAIALESALDPIVDLCLQLGITSPEMERLLRGVFVRRAAKLLVAGSPKRSPSDLRIGLMTGVHRNFVREIRAAKPKARLQQVQQRHPAAGLLRAWATDWTYLTSVGSPRELPMEASAGEPSFAALVSLYMPGIRPSTALAELQRAGTLQVLPHGKIRLRSRSTVYPGLTEENIESASATLTTLTTNLLHNLKSPQERWTCETSDPFVVEPQRLPLTRQTLQKRTQSFLDNVSSEFANEPATGIKETPTSVRVTVFCHETSAASQQSKDVPKTRRGGKP